MSRKETHELSIFIFRRDHRLKDNTGLNICHDESKKIIPLFIFDPHQIGAKNTWKSDRAISFMTESLIDLQKALKSNLLIENGKPHAIIEKLIKRHKNLTGVYVNTDYTPYSKKRDKKIEAVCKRYNAEFVSTHDSLLLGAPTQKTYKVFTPFYNANKRQQIDKPTSRNVLSKISSEYKSTISDIKKYETKSKGDLSGGRAEAKKILNRAKNQDNYKNSRDDLPYETTRLSPYINFGNVSIREVYEVFRKIKNTQSRAELIKQLFWRDFYANISNEREVTTKIAGPYDSKWNIKWKSNQLWLDSWRNGNTGYPVVDAAMRQMNATGFMHNRARMIVASFLSKHMLLDWQNGEKYFSQQLMDMSMVQNHYNWQWVSGTGSFAQPYFRVFNPWEQSKKFDPECEYIKQWIPELKDVPPADIHKWYDKHSDYNTYFSPLFDHAERRDAYLAYIKKHVK